MNSDITENSMIFFFFNFISDLIECSGLVASRESERAYDFSLASVFLQPFSCSLGESSCY